jgi:hypothetical protein
VPGPGTPAPAATPSGPAGPNPTLSPSAGAALPYSEPLAATAALPARTWLLAPEEYALAVQSVIGTTIDVSDMDPIPDAGVYSNMSASGIVRLQLAEQYASKAQAAIGALGDAALAALVPCGELAASCRDDFLSATLSKAFRRPPSPDDLARYREIFELGAPTSDPGLPFRSVLRAALTSPYFLYRSEIGAVADAAASSFKLTSHEVATFLSFSVLGRPPTTVLRAAADRGELTEPAKLGMHVGALLDQPGAPERFGRFVLEWLRLHHFDDDVTKFDSVFAGFSAVRNEMLEESRAFLRQNGGMQSTLANLLTAPVPAPAAALASFYASDPSGATAPARIGVLSLGALLAKTAKPYLTSPTLRGLFVRDQLLCQHISLPENFTPPPIEDTEKTAQPRTTRQLYEQHTRDSACAGCHSLLDSVGFLFENFDGAGRSRTTEIYDSPSFTATTSTPQPIDASGELVGTDVDGRFTSYLDLVQALNRSAWVKECVARQAFRYYFGEVEFDRGIPPVIAGTRALRESGMLGSLVLNLLSSSSTYERIR